MSDLKRLGPISLLIALSTGIGAASCADSSEDTAASGQGTTAASGSGGAAGGAGGSASSSVAGGGAAGGCSSDRDCTGDPGGPVCDVAAGTCVPCLPSDDPCPVGQYCDPDAKKCAVGCTDDSDCGSLTCDTATNTCVGCMIDIECPLGSICINTTCLPGCSQTQGCQAGFDCCGTICADLTSDPQHCGDCTNACPPGIHASSACVSSTCAIGPCDAGWDDCNQMAADGCEWNVLQDGPCVCSPGAVQSCYGGAPGTDGVGPCKSGSQTCDSTGLSWGPCLGQVLPAAETCGNGVDEDCDGTVDNAGADPDGDGWGQCDGDCCDTPAGCSTDPKLVNPGAWEIVGNGVDDDCDPATSDSSPPPSCSTQAKFAAVTGDDVAKAIELCQFTTANPPMSEKKWGVISAQQLKADGSAPSAQVLANMQGSQTAILAGYGTNVGPTKASTMAGLSSGMMRDAGDAGYVQPNTGTSFGNGAKGSPPQVYLNAHGGQLPSSQGCSGQCPAGTGANDSVNVRLTIRVPTNAQSFSYQFKYHTAEYWQWSCTKYNDFYLALLQSAAPAIPADHDISFDDLGNPVSVNNGFFNVCQPKGCYTCPSGASALAGTGMDESVPSLQCMGMVCMPVNPYGDTGGATNWLTTEAPVIPGETIVLDLMVFDVSDQVLDSLVLLDNFAWSPATATVSTHE